MSRKFEFSNRLNSLPPYIFSQINAIKAEVSQRGIKLLSLAIGDPDKPTPAAILNKIKEATDKTENHAYSPYEGTLAFRTSVQQWFKRRFGVDLDPQREILSLIGSKEGIAHFPVAFCNPGDKCLIPSPGYPIFATSVQLADAVVVPLPLRSENGFVPDPKEVDRLMTEHKPKMMILNFPNNPTSAVCSLEILTEVVQLCLKHNVILVHDNAYSEIYYDAANKPPSILQIPGAKEIAIEFHSLSKTFNMTGWRLGFAVGNADLVAGLGKAKTNIDSGPLLAIQEAGSFALQNSEMLAGPIRDVYAERKTVLLQGLEKLGIEYLKPEATFYVWAHVPHRQPSMEFVRGLIEQEGVVLTPGIGFGAEGEYFFRMALTVDFPEMDEALTKFARYLKR
jgi:LL-diaminopimelate aminotransferase